MMRQRATVDRILPGEKAEVLIVRESACSGDCHHCEGCGSVQQTLRIEADNPIGAGRGDIVWLEGESNIVLKGAALVYLLPLLLFLAAYLAAMSLGGWAAAIGCGAFLIGMIPAVLYNRKIQKRPPRYRIVGHIK